MREHLIIGAVILAGNGILQMGRADKKTANSALATGLLIAPALVIFTLCLVWPVCTIVVRSLNENGKVVLFHQIYLGNYASIFTDSLLLQVTLQSLYLAAVATFVCGVLAFPTAYLISRMSASIASAMMVLIFAPFWVSIIVRLFAFTTILGQNGIINTAAGSIGLGPFPMLYNTFGTVVGMVSYLLPYLILILLSAMLALDSSVLTAARTMGASEYRIFRDIYFPQIRPALVGGLVVIFVMGLGFFLTPAILGGPHNLTIPLFIQQQLQSYQWGKASAMGIALLAFSLLGYFIALRLAGRDILSPMQSVGRGVAANPPLRLTPVNIACIIVFIFNLVLMIAPLVIVLFTSFTETSQVRFPPVGFSWRWYEEVLTSASWRQSFTMSVRIAGLTALLSTFCGLALARAGTRVVSPPARALIQVVAISPLIVPQILLAIGMYDVFGRLSLVGTDLGLVLAHSLICLPLTFLVAANGLSAIDISIEQAAWTMGASQTRGFFEVVLPNVIPAIVGAVVIALVTSWDEAVLSIFITQFNRTLPVAIYSMVKSGITPAVSAVASMIALPVLIAASVAALRVLRRGRRRQFLDA
ncbi:ABC transporter permease [Mesorhizobium abyssinicae]|uniref:ABC transporter permease n=1 Tax=Mesorhizobium abyssinicae TaxID=1209958 RepID=UPI00339705C4